MNQSTCGVANITLSPETSQANNHSQCDGGNEFRLCLASPVPLPKAKSTCMYIAACTPPNGINKLLRLLFLRRDPSSEVAALPHTFNSSGRKAVQPVVLASRVAVEEQTRTSQKANDVVDSLHIPRSRKSAGTKPPLSLPTRPLLLSCPHCSPIQSELILIRTRYTSFVQLAEPHYPTNEDIPCTSNYDYPGCWKSQRPVFARRLGNTTFTHAHFFSAPKARLRARCGHTPRNKVTVHSYQSTTKST